MMDDRRWRFRGRRDMARKTVNDLHSMLWSVVVGASHSFPSHRISSHISWPLHTLYLQTKPKSTSSFGFVFVDTHRQQQQNRPKENPEEEAGAQWMGQSYWNDGAATQRIQHILRQIIESGQWSERPQSWDGTDERDRWSDPSMWVFKNRDSTEDNPRDIISILGPTLIRVILQPALSTFNWICLTHVNAAATPPESTRLVISEDSYWYPLISACLWAHAQYSHSHRTADPQSCRPPHAHQSGLVALISRSSTDIL